MPEAKVVNEGENRISATEAAGEPSERLRPLLTPPGFVRENTYKYSEQRNDSNLKSLDENIEHYWKYHPKLFRIAFTVSRLQTVEALEKDVQPKRGR